MGLPNVVKTWQFQVNNPVVASYEAMWLLVKNLLKTFPLNPWTVVRSCDSVSVSASDLWVTSANVVINNPGVAHSWIVLQNNAIAPGFQILIEPKDNGGGNPNDVNIFASHVAGFTGGSTTARATATDETTICSGIASCNNVTPATNNIRVHAWESSDGQCTRIVLASATVPATFILFDKPKNPVSGWTVPWVGIAVGSPSQSAGGNRPTFSSNNDNSNAKSKQGSTQMDLFLTSEGYIAGMTGERMTFTNDLDSNGWPMSPMGIACENATVRGRHGEMFDLWWGSTTVNDGDHYPADVSRQFVQVGDAILPWNGGAAILLA